MTVPAQNSPKPAIPWATEDTRTSAVRLGADAAVSADGRPFLGSHETIIHNSGV